MKLNKSKVLLPILLIVILALCYIDVKCIFLRKIFENKFAKEMTNIYELNKNSVFKISKIIKYSSAEAEDNSPQQNLQDVSIHQYSDMAIYIDNLSEELNEKNTVKELYLDNFNIDIGYKGGNPALYYKSPYDISKFRLNQENEIKDKLEYTIINTNHDNVNNNYETPIFFADCSNPITIAFVNKDIVQNYQVTKENGLVSFDGRILDNLDIDLNKLSPKINFTVHLKNYLNEEYICNASVKFSLENNDGSVESGYIIQILDDIGYYGFFRKM